MIVERRTRRPIWAYRRGARDILELVIKLAVLVYLIKAGLQDTQLLEVLEVIGGP